MADTMKYKSTVRMLSLLAVAAVAAFHTKSTVQAGDVTATWDGTTNNWSSVTDWSTNPDYPNNGTPSGVDYSVVIDSSGTGPYTLTLDNSAGNSGTVNINSVTIDNSNATFDQTSGTLDLTGQPSGIAGGAANVQSGTYDLSGGTLANATLTVGASGAFVDSGGTLQNVALGSDVTLSASSNNITIGNTLANAVGLNFNGHAVNIEDNGNLDYRDAYNSTTSQYVGDSINGNVNLIGVNSIITADSGGLTISSGVTVTASSGGYNEIRGNAVTNNGMIAATTNGTDLTIDPSTFANTGTVEASGGGTIDFSGNWSNQGTIAAGVGGTVNFGSTFTAADVGLQSSGLGGTFTPNGATVNITGTLDNTGNTLTFSSATGVWNLGGTIENGTLIAANQANGASYLTISDGALQNVTLGGDLTLSKNTSIANTLANVVGLNFNGHAVNIEGNGDLNYQDAYNSSTSQYVGDSINGDVNLIGVNSMISAGSGGLTVDSGTTITASSGGYNYIRGNAVTNNGTIASTNGANLTIDPQTFTNNGTLALHNGTITSSNLAVGAGMLTGSGTISGNVTLSSDPSTLAFNLGGEAQGTQYDSLAIDGNITLAGNLELTLSNGFVPLAGDSFTVLTVGSGYALSGAFLDAANGGRLVDTNGTGSFLVNYGSGAYANEIVLTNFQAVPEPASLALLALAGAGMLLLKRRRVSV